MRIPESSAAKDGSVDETFVPELPIGSEVSAAVVQPDGKVLVAYQRDICAHAGRSFAVHTGTDIDERPAIRGRSKRRFKTAAMDNRSEIARFMAGGAAP